MLATRSLKEDLALEDMRQHTRMPLALFGHYSIGDDVELPCLTTDVSEGGVGLTAVTRGAPGERVTLHLNGIGKLEGEIVRGFEGGFAIALDITAERQAQLSARLAEIYDNSALSIIEAPMASQDHELFDAMRFDAEMVRGGRSQRGETSGRVMRGARGAELEFRCARD